jgi:acetolactate synthase-1/2/3 large subunit
MMKLSDYVIRYLADYGLRHIFMVTGGGAMHLNDSIGKESRIQYICNHHEQACAMAAEGYARINGKIGVICVTTGPGGINALNGVFGAWTDSVPMLIISGQVKSETCMAFNNVPGLRQLGDQEVDIISMVKGITKYAVLIREPESIRYHLEKALHLATSGRPGPCWLDIPLDVQSATIDEKKLMKYKINQIPKGLDSADLGQKCADILSRLNCSVRPLILAGNGIRHAGAVDLFRSVMESLRIPVVTSRSAADLIPSDNPYYCGRAGIDGQRAGNFNVQNADTLLCIGTRLSLRQTGYEWKAFAREAFRIQVDVDQAELSKPSSNPHFPIQCDAKSFLKEMLDQIEGSRFQISDHSEWLIWCKERLAQFPLVPSNRCTSSDMINPYKFVQDLFGILSPDDVIVCGNGSAFIMSIQAGEIKPNQRLFFNSGCASMGYDMPAAIGACVANQGRRTICLAGDGSLQMNIQELQTIVHHGLPIKLFVFNNRGYLSIRQTQEGFFGRLTGEGPTSGVTFPELESISRAYGIPFIRLTNPGFGKVIQNILENNKPTICEVCVDPNQCFEPKASSRQLDDGRIISAPLEDMFPFLSRDEFKQNMLIPEYEA